MEVPEILFSGHHANIEKWRHEKALEKTLKMRPDLLEKCDLCKSDIDFLDKIKNL